MKKKLICLFLMLCLLLAAIPAMMLGAASSEEKTTEADYDALYVRQDKLTIWLEAFDSSSANTNLDLAGGKWYSKVGDAYAELRASASFPWVALENGGIGWKQYASQSLTSQSNGIYFDVSLIPMGDYTVEVVMTMDGILEDDGTRYTEYATSSTGSDGKEVWTGARYGLGHGEGFAVGTFRSYQYTCLHNRNGSASVDSLGNKWFYTGMAYTDHYSSPSASGRAGAFVGGTNPDSHARTNPVGYIFKMTMRAEYYDPTEINLRVLYNDEASSQATINAANFNYGGVLPANNAGYGGDPTKYIENRVKFQLMVGVPGSVYAVRVYDVALSEEEQRQNTFADIARMTGASLSVYKQMNDELKSVVHKSVVKLGYGAKKYQVEEAIAEAQNVWQAEQDRIAAEALKREELIASLEGRDFNQYDKYYVQNGLQIFLDGFVSVSEFNNTLDLETGKWTSKVNYSGSATEYQGQPIVAEIGGLEYWKAGSDGMGIGFRFTKAQYKASLISSICPAGISFDPALLEDTLTIETVAKFIGLTDEYGERYIDGAGSADSYGVYSSNYSTFSFGGLKAMTFLCKSLAQYGTDMGNRWCYTEKEWNQHNGSAGYTQEYLFQTMDPKTATTFTMTKRVASGLLVANIYSGIGSDSESMSVRKNALASAEIDPEFHVFKGMPSQVYAIRVYNRLLTDAERSQNHMADLLSFYGLDTTFLDMVLSSIANPAELYPLFDDIGFGLTPKEAQNAFNGALSGAWIRYMGASVRLDNKAAFRFVFELDENAIAILRESGCTIEIGTLLNVGDNVPTLDSYEHRMVYLAADGTRGESYYLSIDPDGVSTVATQVSYVSFTPTMAITDLSVASYVVLTTPDGEVFNLYIDCTSRKYDCNLFSLYNYMQINGYAEHRYVNSVLDSCFDDVLIEVDSEGGDDENAFDEGPVRTLNRAYELVKDVLATSEVPVDIVISLEEGTYVINDKLTIDGKDAAQRYFRLTLEGVEDDGSVITTNEQFDDGSGFVSVPGTDYYSYQFEPDEDGNYPDFRYLYVDGVIQEIALNGYNRSHLAELDGGVIVGDHLDNMWTVPATVVINGKQEDNNARDTGDNKLYIHIDALDELGSDYDPSAEGSKLEFHMAMAWYYKIVHIDRIDWNDISSDGEYVAVYFDAAEHAKLSYQHNYSPWYYWVQNAPDFIDRPGEYYYDKTTGELLYYPSEDVDITDAVFAYPTNGHMLSFYDIENLTIRDIVFTGNDSSIAEGKVYNGGQANTMDGDYGANTLSALYFTNAKNVKVTGCLFNELATSGLRFVGCSQNLLIEENRFFKIGSSSMEFGIRSGTWEEGVNTNENIEVYNNYLDDIAWLTRGSVGIWVGVVKGIEIHYNTIHNTSYTGISIGWRWSPVDWGFGDTWHVYNADLHHNFFAGVMSDQSDGGAIYTLGGNVSETYHEYFNYMHDNFYWLTARSWNSHTHTMIMPYYHDGASSNWETYANVQIQYPGAKVHTTIYLQNITSQLVHNIYVHDNEIVTCNLYNNWLEYEDRIFDDNTELVFEYRVFGSDGNRRKPVSDGTGYAYYSRVDDTRFLYQEDNYLYSDPMEMEWSGYVVSMIEDTGSDFCKPDVYMIIDEMQPLYDAFYEELYNKYIEE